MKKGMCLDFEHLVVGHGFTSTQKDEKGVNIRRELLKQSILVLSPTLARIHSLFRDTMMSSNEAKFDENLFPFRKEKVVEQ